MLSTFLGLLLSLTCLFLIVLVLLQRGRGGGLTGALGGSSQSAFGAKAGDTFTWITVGAASFWILLCMVIILTVNQKKDFGEGTTSDGTLSGDVSDGELGGGLDLDVDTTEVDTTEGTPGTDAPGTDAPSGESP